MDVAAATPAPGRRHERLAFHAQIGDQAAAFLVEDLRPGRDLEDQVGAGVPVPILVRAGLSRGREVFMLVTKIQQRRQAAVDGQDDAAAIAAVAACGSPLGDELLAAKGHGPLPPAAPANIDMNLVDELHGATTATTDERPTTNDHPLATGPQARKPTTSPAGPSGWMAAGQAEGTMLTRLRGPDL